MKQDNGMTDDMRMLALLDLSDAKGGRLTLSSVVRMMREGYTLQDFMDEDEGRLMRLRANTKRSILGLLEEATEEELLELNGGKSLYRLVLTDGGISEQTVRNLLHPSGLSYGQLEGLDYETFRQMMGGGERRATFAKLIRSYEADGGERNVSEDAEGVRTKKIGVRQLRQMELDLTILYDDMEDKSLLHDWAEKAGREDEEVRVGIESLVKKGMLEFVGDSVVKRTKFLRDALEIIPELHKSMLVQRLSGLTLYEVGEANGITRERVRQVVKKALIGIPLTHVVEARRVRYLYENYSLDADFFEKVLLESKEVYRFMSEKCEKGIIDKRQVYPLLRSDERKRMLVSEKLFEDLHGDAVTLSKSSIVEKYYVLSGHETEHISVHHQRYIAFVEEELRGREDVLNMYKISERAFEGISDRIEGCLQSAGRKVRYLNLQPILDERETIQEFFVLDPGVYNTRLVYDAHMEYFQSLDVQNHHELHNIMKDNLKIDSIHMRRMPEFSVVMTKKLDWLISLIDEMGPIPLETFIVQLEKTYGLSVPSTRSLIQMELSDYITPQNHLANDIPKLSEQEEVFIRSILVDDIYTIQELVERHEPEIEGFRQRYLNNRNLSLIGYDLRLGVVIKKGFGSAEKYFRELVLSKDYFRRDHSPAQNTQSFWKVLLDLQTSLDLFRVEEDVYLNISVLEGAGVGKETIADFREKVISHFSDGRFYTMKNILHEIEHPVLDLGFEDVFYERICRSGTDVRFIPTSSRDILYQAKKKRNQTDFLRHLVTDGTHIDDLLADIVEKYGIVLDKAKVIEKIKSSDMHYIPEMERIFIDKQVFLNKIYDEE